MATTRKAQSDEAPQIPCVECPLLACPGLRPLAPEQLEFIFSIKAGEMNLDRGADILVQGSISPHLYTLLDGIAFRFKTLDDGRRQIVNFLFPGDLVGLQGAMDDPLNHGVEALSAVKLCVFPRKRIYEIFTSHPQLGYDMTWLAAKEETALDDHLLALGQRKADERTVYLALFLFTRGEEVGLTKGDTLPIQVTQAQLADSLGLSLVHTNKTLQNLRRRGILDWQPDRVVLKDRDKACDLAKFDLAPSCSRPFI